MSQTVALILTCPAGIVLGAEIGLVIPRRHIAKWALFPGRKGAGR